MRRQRTPPSWRLLLSLTFVAGIIAVVPGRPVQRSAAAPTPPSTDSTPSAPAPGSDLAQLDTDTGHYTQESNGLTQLDLYNSPVGNPSASGWHVRDPQVRASSGAGAFTPANLPFRLHIAPTSAAPVLASLTNEGGVALGVGIAAIDGASPANVPGRASDGGVTYPTIVSSTVTIPATDTNPLPIAGALSSSTIAAVRLASHDRVTSSLPRLRGRLASTLTALPVVSGTVTTTSTVVATSTAPATTTAVATSTVPTTTTAVATGTVVATGTIPATTTAVATGTFAATSTVSATPVATTGTVAATSAPSATATPLATSTPATTKSLATTSDLVLRPTISGLDVRLVLRNAAAAGTFVLSLFPDPRLQAAQDADGAIRLTRTMTSYGDDGVTPYVVTGPEYLVHPPVALDSSPDPASPAQTGSTTMTLLPATSGPRAVLVSVDPAWLRAPTRVFPVRVDVSIATAYSAANTGVIGTVNSCAPSVRAPLAAVVVGSEGACTYRGELSFNTTSLLPDTPILDARLRLYTPDQPGATGVRVYPNVPVPDLSPPQQPSWSTAPAVIPGATGIAQSGSAGRWQTWDVTGLVRQWVRDAYTNGGLTLAAAGMPVRFASPLGAGAAAPAVAPALQITYGPRPTAAPAGQQPQAPSPYTTVDDGAGFIFGVSGSFGDCGVGSPLHLCGDGGPTALSAAASNPTAGFGAGFIRFGPVQLGCMRPLPNGYWDKQAYVLLTAAYYNNPRLIPIVDFTAPPTSQCTLSNRDWHDELQNFVVKMQFYHDPQGRTIPRTYPALYVEVGNEPNLNTSQYPDYPDIFAAGAAGLYTNLNPTAANITFPFYRILTGGMIGPTADRNCSNVSNVQLAEGAINAAKSAGNPYGMVNPVDLGVAVHPYGYRGTQNSVWPNYTSYGHTYQSSCSDLTLMNDTWTSDPTFAGMPVVYTEINWSTNTIDATAGNQQYQANAEGSYLVDLFGYLHNHNFTQAPATSPLRVMWFRGSDVIESGNQRDPLGIYNVHGGEKTANIPTCPDNRFHIPSTPFPTLSNDYYWLRNGECHSP